MYICILAYWLFQRYTCSSSMFNVIKQWEVGGPITPKKGWHNLLTAPHSSSQAFLQCLRLYPCLAQREVQGRNHALRTESVLRLKDAEHIMNTPPIHFRRHHKDGDQTKPTRQTEYPVLPRSQSWRMIKIWNIEREASTQHCLNSEKYSHWLCKSEPIKQQTKSRSMVREG